MSFLCIYLIGAGIMMAIALGTQIFHKQIKVSDLIAIVIDGVLSWAGVAVVLVTFISKLIECAMDSHGNNKVIWKR